MLLLYLLNGIVTTAAEESGAVCGVCGALATTFCNGDDGANSIEGSRSTHIPLHCKERKRRLKESCGRMLMTVHMCNHCCTLMAAQDTRVVGKMC